MTEDPAPFFETITFDTPDGPRTVGAPKPGSTMIATGISFGTGIGELADAHNNPTVDLGTVAYLDCIGTRASDNAPVRICVVIPDRMLGPVIDELVNAKSQTALFSEAEETD